MTESDIHFRVIKNKLIPELHKYLGVAKTELEYAWPIDVPSSRGNYAKKQLFKLDRSL